MTKCITKTKESIQDAALVVTTPEEVGGQSIIPLLKRTAIILHQGEDCFSRRKIELPGYFDYNPFSLGNDGASLECEVTHV